MVLAPSCYRDGGLWGVERKQLGEEGRGSRPAWQVHSCIDITLAPLYTRNNACMLDVLAYHVMSSLRGTLTLNMTSPAAAHYTTRPPCIGFVLGSGQRYWAQPHQ